MAESSLPGDSLVSDCYRPKADCRDMARLHGMLSLVFSHENQNDLNGAVVRSIEDFKPFVPSDDYETSKAFYQCMGFTVSWDAEEVCEIDTGFGYRFLLLPKNHNNYGESLMLHFMVDSAQAWYDHFVSVGLSAKFPTTKVAPPAMQPWGLLITYVWDPAGVLLHFAEDPGDSD